MNPAMRGLCLAFAFCVSFSTLGTTDGFQHQSIRSHRHPYKSTGVPTGGTCQPRTIAPLPPLSSPARGSSSATQLEALPALSTSPIGALAVLAGIVVVHEAGHYLSARYFNITVEEFSIGFGPKLFGFDAFGNEFNLRALPLGGYVRFPENYDGEAAFEVEDLKRQARRIIRQNEPNQKNFKDELLNRLTLGYWNEQKFEERRKAKQAEREEAAKKAGFLARLFGGKKRSKPSGDAVDLDEVYQNLDELEKYEVEYYDDPQLLQNRPWPERAVVLSGGVIFNLLLAFSIYFAAIGPLPVEGLPRVVFDDGVVVTQAPRSDGPSNGLLRQGDIITGINGQSVQCTSKTSVSAGQKQVSDVISAIRATPDGESVSVNVLRAEGQAAKSETAPKRSPQTFRIQPERTGDTQTIGVMLGPRFDRMERIKSDNPIVALKLAWEYLSDMFTQTLVGTVSVLTSFLSTKGPPPGQKISGPIGLISQGSSVVATRDVTAVLLFAAGLSVNLGVINALPLPALDGGQLVFVVAEALTGKKVDQKFQEGITSIAVFFLLWLSLNAAIGDVGSLFK